MEHWKDIKGYEGHYQVSDLGRVRSLGRQVIFKKVFKKQVRNRILKHGIDKGGYHHVRLYLDGKAHLYKVHTLVTQEFLGHVSGKDKKVVDHINNNKDNNTLSNLQVITHRKNVSKNRQGSSQHTGVCWAKHSRKWVAQIYLNRKVHYLGTFSSEEAAAKIYTATLEEFTSQNGQLLN